MSTKDITHIIIWLEAIYLSQVELLYVHDIDTCWSYLSFLEEGLSIGIIQREIHY